MSLKDKIKNLVSGGPDLLNEVEAIPDPNSPEVKSAQARQVLENEPGFIPFLAKVTWAGNTPQMVEDALDNQNAQVSPEILRVYTVYKQRQQVSQKLRSFIDGETSSALNMAASSLPDAENRFDWLDDRLDKMAQENPHKLEALMAQLEGIEKTKIDINNREVQLAAAQHELGGREGIIQRMATLREANDNVLNKIKPEFLRSNREQELAAFVSENYGTDQVKGSLLRVGSYMAQERKNLQSLKQAEEAKKNLAANLDMLKTAVISGSIDLAAIMEEVRKASTKALEEQLTQAQTLQDILAVQDVYDTRSKGGSIMWQNDVISQRGIQKDVDNKIADLLSHEISTAVDGLLSNPEELRLGAALDSLSHYFKMDNLGSHKGEQARELVLKVMDGLINETRQKNPKDPKLILLSAAKKKFTLPKKTVSGTIGNGTFNLNQVS